MKIISMMDYNYNNQNNKMPVHTELVKFLMSNGKMNDNAALWAELSEETEVLKLAKAYYLNKEQYQMNNYTEGMRKVA